MDERFLTGVWLTQKKFCLWNTTSPRETTHKTGTLELYEQILAIRKSVSVFLRALNTCITLWGEEIGISVGSYRWTGSFLRMTPRLQSMYMLLPDYLHGNPTNIAMFLAVFHSHSEVWASIGPCSETSTIR